MSDDVEELAELAKAAWAEIKRVLEVADPGAIDGLPEGGAFRIDPSTMPPVVSFRFAPLTLSYDPLTGSVVESRDDGRERAFDRYGRRLQGVLEPPAPG